MDTKKATQEDCRKAWDVWRDQIEKAINEINDATPWSETEPDWWLDMMSVYSLLMIQKERIQKDQSK